MLQINQEKIKLYFSKKLLKNNLQNYEFYNLKFKDRFVNLINSLFLNETYNHNLFGFLK